MKQWSTLSWGLSAALGLGWAAPSVQAQDEATATGGVEASAEPTGEEATGEEATGEEDPMGWFGVGLKIGVGGVGESEMGAVPRLLGKICVRSIG
jgi:hypothetical protein